MNGDSDKPRLEVYPWYLVGLFALMWSGIWFVLWAFLRGTLASVVLVLSSIENMSWVPWALPAEFIVWTICAAVVIVRVRAERTLPPLAVVLTLVLLVTLPSTAFYPIMRMRALSEFELSRDGTAGVLLSLLDRGVPDHVAALCAIAVASAINRFVLNRRYRDLRPVRGARAVAAWIVAAALGFWIACALGRFWGFAFAAALGNAVTIHCFRDAIRAQMDRAPQ